MHDQFITEAIVLRDSSHFQIEILWQSPIYSRNRIFFRIVLLLSSFQLLFPNRHASKFLKDLMFFRIIHKIFYNN